MKQNLNISQLQKEILGDSLDIKAESILAIAMDKGFREDEFVVAFESLFNRPYSRDILYTGLEEAVGNRDFLQLHVSRNGLHDLVPEGLFYQPEDIKFRDFDAALMAAEHQKNKKKEKEIRRFFMPFENAFFSELVHLEREETQLLEGMGSGILNEYFMEFWGISGFIPSEYITPLISLLPHATKITGNIPLIGQCLEKILSEKVRITIIKSTAHQTDRIYQKGLDEGKLGMDIVLGGDFFEDFLNIEVSIGPLQNSSIQDYLEGGNKESFLKTFYSYFLPAEAEVSTHIKIESKNQHMFLSPEEEPVLGYSSVLGN